MFLPAVTDFCVVARDGCDVWDRHVGCEIDVDGRETGGVILSRLAPFDGRGSEYTHSKFFDRHRRQPFCSPEHLSYDWAQ